MIYKASVLTEQPEGEGTSASPDIRDGSEQSWKRKRYNAVGLVLLAFTTFLTMGTMGYELGQMIGYQRELAFGTQPTHADNTVVASQTTEHASSLSLSGTPDRSNNRTRYCALVVSKLYGTHSANRINTTINWYKQLTLESIRLAARYSTEHFDYIGAFLWADGVYATEPSTSILQHGSDIGIPIHVARYESLNQLFPLILQEKSCDVVSVVRIDADDALSPNALENIRWAWKMNRCNSNCAQVAGSKKVKRMTMAPLTKDGQLNCQISSSIKAYFGSAGLSVTLPVKLLRHFDDKIICFGNHVHLSRNIKRKMEEVGLQGESYQVPDHGLLPLTPLSSHYDYNKPDAMHGPLQNCKLDYLRAELGQDMATLVWKARNAIPNLSQEEWKQNGFVKACRRGCGKWGSEAPVE